MFKFEIQKTSKKSKARVGTITTPHGKIQTPAFIPVATFGVVKGGLDFKDFQKTKTQCQITNTFHFIDLDRTKKVKKYGGLHNFFNCNKPIFTDSGGFQVFSLGKGAEFGLGKIGSIFPGQGKREKPSNSLVKRINDRGVHFKSPRDGREIWLTPESSAQAQKELGADFIYLFDVCGSPLDGKQTTKKEMELSHSWFERFLKTDISSNQKVFGIIQGGIYKDLRIKSAEFVNNLDVFGIAIGGALGKKKEDMYRTISWVNEKIDWQRPHHLLGIGDLDVMERIIKLGIDLFDCALPTRIARHGIALTSKGPLDLKKTVLKDKFKPLDKDCNCFVCQNYTQAQINFFFKSKEQIAGRLLTIHNLYFIETLLEKIREKIAENKF